MRGEDGDSNTKVPARIREIITKNLAADDNSLYENSIDLSNGHGGFDSILNGTGGSLNGSMTSPSILSLQEENRMLQNELSRVEDLLSSSRADRDEVAIKYQALADRVSRLYFW